MENSRPPKWEIGQAILKGNQAVELATKYQTEIGTRLKPNELTELASNTEELEKRRTGQTENLINQKSKTKTQDEVMSELHTLVMDIRDMVKAKPANADVTKSFGVGEKVAPQSIPSVVAAGNVIVAGYNANTEWANNEAGIIEDDITEITQLMESLGAADKIQEGAKFERKAKTLDKNTLQREVEDLVTKISAIGARVFRKTDPGVAKLFEDLIP